MKMLFPPVVGVSKMPSKSYKKKRHNLQRHRFPAVGRLLLQFLQHVSSEKRGGRYDGLNNNIYIVILVFNDDDDDDDNNSNNNNNKNNNKNKEQQQQQQQQPRR